MSDATTPPGAPPQVAEPTPRAGPGPIGAAVDPPPCVTPKAAMAQLEGRAGAGAPFPPPFSSEIWGQTESSIPQFRPVMPGPRSAYETVVEPVHLGKQTSQAELAKLVQEVKTHGLATADTPKG